ncbi:uncharacterized protein RCO7_14626 [Rhynchosporium graminicola]|uniref:Uncharacterized protein n=1 Tax=Rhynchosporium graminicola TaxID=2792576 RepID=A0A1E1KSF8_9HELO|nr:uncharacterized protein RCO7_14626 [Rhynchosporium commune]
MSTVNLRSNHMVSPSADGYIGTFRWTTTPIRDSVTATEGVKREVLLSKHQLLSNSFHFRDIHIPQDPDQRLISFCRCPRTRKCSVYMQRLMGYAITLSPYEIK